MVSLIHSKTFIFHRFGGDSVEDDAKIGGKTQKFEKNQSNELLRYLLQYAVTSVYCGIYR